MPPLELMDEVYCMCEFYEMHQLITKLKLGIVTSPRIKAFCDDFGLIV